MRIVAECGPAQQRSATSQARQDAQRPGVGPISRSIFFCVLVFLSPLPRLRRHRRLHRELTPRRPRDFGIQSIALALLLARHLESQTIDTAISPGQCPHTMARRRALRWLLLVLLSSRTAAAAGMSLSNFQLITSTSVPLSCILAYNQPLVGCTMGDFTQGGPGATCSQECQRGILSTQSTLQLVCQQSGAPANSVLGQALLGNLISFLCGGAPSTSATAFTRATQASTTAIALPAPSSEAASADVIPPDPTPAQVQPPANPETPTPLPPPNDTTGARQTKTPSAPKQPQSDSTRGGGSPFDAVVNGSDDLQPDWGRSLLLALSLGLALLQ